ncbi:MAG: type IX secretion system outer membrane channel protein PorV [Bacteroidota bacterium]
MEIWHLKPNHLQIRENNSLKIFLFSALLIWTGSVIQGQISVHELTGADLNRIQTAVPFLTIAPDGRSSGMGDVGAASTPDLNSQHWNSGKYAFVEGKGGMALTYTPWITNLIPDVTHLYLASYYKIDNKSTVSSSLRYFSLGTITFSSIGGPVVGVYHPREFALDAGFSRKFTDHFSGGVVLRYICSDLTHGQPAASGDETNAGTSFAGDLGFYYQDDIQVGEKDAQWAAGLNISNVGTPISYTEDADKTPIPTNLRLGGRFSYNINENNTLSIHADLNKLLVPTPPVYMTDSATNDQIIVRGKAAPESVILGMFQSFYDAPGVDRGNGVYSIAAEEFNEIYYGLGAEYKYRNRFVIRTGYFHEHSSKGNRKYFTMGVGTQFSIFSLDFSYLVPTKGHNHPLSNTFRLMLTATFGTIATPPNNGITL